MSNRLIHPIIAQVNHLKKKKKEVPSSWRCHHVRSHIRVAGDHFATRRNGIRMQCTAFGQNPGRCARHVPCDSASIQASQACARGLPRRSYTPHAWASGCRDRSHLGGVIPPSARPCHAYGHDTSVRVPSRYCVRLTLYVACMTVLVVP